MEVRESLHRILVVGGGAREHAIGEALCRRQGIELLVVAHNDNPGLSGLSTQLKIHEETDVKWIAKWARDQGVDLAVIGLEDPLATGLPDALKDVGIPTIGPCQEPARVETSKLFARDIMRRYGIPGQVEYHHFTDIDALKKFLKSSTHNYALKPVGLTAGKGVKVMGEHFGSVEEAIDYGEMVIRTGIGGTSGLIVEERLIGEEFTLQTFVDGEVVVPMPLVQDFKRAFEGDTGPNTGGMGSYSQSDGLLPFITQQERDAALEILRGVIDALRSEGMRYQGILYGQFMVTDKGVKLVEMNARFGDPEAINVLPLLENDFVDVCRAIANGTLRDVHFSFARKATVCKYITPPGYGVEPKVGVPIKLDIPKIKSLGVNIFFAKVNQRAGKLLTTTSRSIALLGIADSVEQAEELVEESLHYVHGEYYVRHDIAKKELLQSKVLKTKAIIAA